MSSSVLASPAGSPAPTETTPRTRYRLLLVDDEMVNRNLCRMVLEAEDLTCDEAANGQLALDALAEKRYDLILLDIDMPVMTGTELLQRLRQHPPSPHLKIIMLSGRATGDEMAEMMSGGADDYLSKPFSPVQLLQRVKAALRLKTAQDRTDALMGHLLAINHDLEEMLHARDSDLVHARNALVLALAELVGHRDIETGTHLMRLKHYCRCLAGEASKAPSFANQIDENYIQMLDCCAPLHDIGKAALPDNVLLKPGSFTPEERRIMQTHTTIGADTLQKVAEEHGFARAFLQMAMDIARHHHERYDGNGYPDRLRGEDIPLAARILTIGDVYDALRSRRVYKPGLAHQATLEVMQETAAGQFDPALFQIFLHCADRFAQIYRELTA